MPILAKEDGSKIRKEVIDLSKWLHATRDETEKKFMRLANLVHQVQRRQLFRSWIDPATKKPYRSFDSWLFSEVGQSRASVYRYLGLKDYLKNVPDGVLEEIGSSRCFELAKVGREKPSLLPRFLKEIKEHPDLPVVSLRNMVANSLAGGSFDSGHYEEICFVVKCEDLPYVHKALAVMQAMDAVENPDTVAGRGVHLVSLAQSFLSGNEESKILKQLEDVGAFSKTPFKVEG